MNKEEVVTSAFLVHHSEFSRSPAAALLDELFEHSVGMSQLMSTCREALSKNTAFDRETEGRIQCFFPTVALAAERIEGFFEGLANAGENRRVAQRVA